MVISIKIEVDLEQEFLENVFMTALEGGSNYWYVILDSEVQKIRRAVPKTRQAYLPVALLEAVMFHGVDVDIHDVENPDGKPIGTISKKTMQKRIQSMADGELGHVIQRELNEMGDASTADAIFQNIVMGEIVYG